MIRRISKFLVLILCTTCSILVHAQLPTQNPNQDPNLNPIGSSVIRDTTDSEVLPLDTPVTMTYVVIADPNEHHSFADTFLWDDNKHVPLDFYQSHLGNYGSPSRSLAPSIDLRRGFFTGWDQYDPYYVFADSFRYYHQHVPVAKIKYSQASQEDTYLTLDFGRTFAKGVSLSFSYDRINQVGKYFHQHQKNTALGLGVWHNAPSGKYDAFYNYLANDAVSEENGGLIDPESVYDTTILTDLGLPVFITKGITTHKYKLFTSKHIVHLVSDTTFVGIDLWVEGRVGSGLYKFIDEDATSDTLRSVYYEPFLVDERGIRQFTALNEYQITGGFSLPWRTARSILESSLSYRSVNLQQEPEENRINELFWNASGKFRWIEPLELKGLISFGLGQASGSFVFRADASLNTNILGKLEGYWSIITRKPFMIEDKLYVNQQLIYDRDFENPFSTEFGVGWNWEEQSLKAFIQWIVFDNYIFYGSSRMPEQIAESFSLRRINVSKSFDFNWIGVKGHFIWQPDAREELAIPELLYTAGAYGRFKIFKKKVTLMPGFDITYHDSFKGVSYFPVIGRYHLSDGNEIPEYFRLDAALGVHINFLKVFVRIDDLIGLRNERVLYQAKFYPHYRGNFRIGIEAGFFN